MASALGGCERQWLCCAECGLCRGHFPEKFALSALSIVIASEVVDGVIEAGIASAVGPGAECQGAIVVGDTIAGRWEQH
jgi:hypothetical protein